MMNIIVKLTALILFIGGGLLFLGYILMLCLYFCGFIKIVFNYRRGDKEE